MVLRFLYATRSGKMLILGDSGKLSRYITIHRTTTKNKNKKTKLKEQRNILKNSLASYTSIFQNKQNFKILKS